MTRDDKEAAKILRGLKDRVDRLTQATFESGVPLLLRRVSDRMMADDVVSRDVATGGTMVWDSGAWGSDAWG